MTRLRNRWEVTSKNPFSFIAPFVIALVFIIIIIKYVFSGSSATENKGGSFITVTPKQEQSEIYIYMSGDSKKKIDGPTKMYSTDSKLVVANGEAEISIEGNTSKLFAKKLAEIKYEWAPAKGKQTFTLENSSAWVETTDQSNIDLKLSSFHAIPSQNTVLILDQNAIASNIYVLKGSVSVETNGTTPWTTTVGVWQQLTVLKNEVNDANFKMVDKIEPVSDYIKNNELYISHNGDSLLISTQQTGSGATTATGTESTAWDAIGNGKNPILITYPEDESSIDLATINIEGNVSGSSVDKITINDKEVSFDKEKRSFILKDFPIVANTNNIVYKAFDKDGWLISKGITIVYSSKKTTKDEIKKPTVTTYPISDKTFQIISPTENPYKTTDDVVRVEGRVVKDAVKYITVNDFRLSKFPQFASSWYYFANKDYGTMNDGINLYTIKYYGTNDELLFTNLLTIVKETKKSETPITAPAATSESTPNTIEEKPAYN